MDSKELLEIEISLNEDNYENVCVPEDLDKEACYREITKIANE